MSFVDMIKGLIFKKKFVMVVVVVMLVVIGL